MKQKPKDVKLRAFYFENNQAKQEINNDISDIQELLRSKLQHTIIKDRGMLLNQGDPMEETDYIAYFDERNPSVLVGAMVKTTTSEETPNMTDEMLNEKSIVIADLNTIQEKGNIVKYLYYFAISKNYLVTNLRKSQKITSFQSYLNWFLAKERGQNIYQIEPEIREQKIKNLKNIRGMKFMSPIKPKKKKKEDDNNEERTIYLKKVSGLKKAVLDFLYPRTSKNYKEIIDDDSITIDILLKFAKKVRDKDNFRSELGNILNNITDTDRVSLDVKGGGQMKLGDVELIKPVVIDVTATGLLVEEQLYEEMEKFLRELNENRQ